MGTGDGVGYFGAGRVEHGYQAEQAQTPLDVVPGGRDLARYQLAPGDGEDPPAAPAVVREGMVEVLAVGVGQGSTDSPGGGSRSARPSTASGDPLVCTHSSLSQASTVVMRRRRGSKRNTPRRPWRRC